jgi:hypothetical protein
LIWALNGISKTDVPSVNEQISKLVTIIRNDEEPTDEALPSYLMGRITLPFRQLYQETVSELEVELKAALVDLGHKSPFDLLLKEAWNPEQAATGNSTLPTVCDKLRGHTSQEAHCRFSSKSAAQHSFYRINQV